MRIASLVVFGSLVAVLGCGPDKGGDDDGGTGADGAVGIDAAAVDANVCTGTLCGQPAVCCETGNECIEGACLPACASGVRCGADQMTCCSAGDVCLADACATPGVACQDSYDCVQPGEFCEPTLGQCLPQPDPLTCEYVPSFSQLDVTIEWMFDTDQIISIPVVADVDGDDLPEVVVNVARQDGLDWPGGNIVVLDGQTGMEQLRIPHNPGGDQYGSHGRSTIAVGDVDGDGNADIVYGSRVVSGGKSLVVAVDGAGALIWTSHDANALDHLITFDNAAVTLANFDTDAAAEVVIGGTLIDNDGLVVWDQGGNGGALGSNSNYRRHLGGGRSRRR